MPYTKTIPQWNATGSQPPQSLIDNGWQANQKPAADYFNWQWNGVYQVLNELHQFALHSERLGAANGIATLGSDSKLTASQLPAIGSAQITDGSITNNDLATDIKVGSLASLATTAKGNVVAAVNEVRSNLNTHTGDASIHVTPANKTAWDAKAETTTATTSANGLMSSADKTKLDGVAANANNYVHPASHPASMITEDTTRRFVSDTEKSAWNVKASTATATTSVNGLMSSADKTKLDGIATGANNYSHPTGDGNQHVPATGTTNNGKFLKSGAAAGSASWQTILAGDVSGLQDLLDGKSGTGHGHDVATTTANGFMSSADKVKLNGVATNANNYSHPTGDGNLHVPATGTTNSGRVLKAGSTAGSLSWGLIDWAEVTGKPSSFTPSAHTHAIEDVTGLQSALDGKSNSSHTHAAATTSVNGFMASADKSKLDGISANANRVTNPATNGVIAIDGVNTTVYTHPTGDGNSHVPATGTTNNGRFLKAGSTAGSVSWQTILAGDVSDLQALLDAKSDTSHGHAAATTSAAGFMAAADKSKLDGIAANANNYVHPASHPASMITEETNRRFMTDAEKAIVNAPKPSWITPTMQNGWESRGGLAFTKLQSGAVVFKGGFISGTNGLAAFTLPVGYRPGQNRFFIVGDASPNGTMHVLTIESSGIVRVNRTTGTGTLAYMDGITFYDDAGV